jgi:hypothetical protein
MPQVLWASSDGRTLIVLNPPGHPGRIAVIRGRQLTLLGQPLKVVFPLAAW